MSRRNESLLKQWRRPRQFRSIIALNPKGIYQVDIMYLKQLWDYIFSQEIRQQPLNDYAVVCVDVYSRYVSAVSIPTRQHVYIREALKSIISDMGKPDWLSGDNEIMDSIYVRPGVWDPFFIGIKVYRTSPDEINKNAIVERMIRTLKWTMMKILMKYYPAQIHFYYISQGANVNFADMLLHSACGWINNKVNRTIKAKPVDVFNEETRSNQEIIKKDFVKLPLDTIVLKIPERLHSQVPIKTFDYDVEPYIIVGHSGMKYYIQKLVDKIQGKALQILGRPGRKKQPKLYKEYELRPFKDYKEALKFLRSPLVSMKLLNMPEYKNGGYDEMIGWIEDNI
jgi:hypothetical protein